MSNQCPQHGRHLHLADNSFRAQLQGSELDPDKLSILEDMFSISRLISHLASSVSLGRLKTVSILFVIFSDSFSERWQFSSPELRQTQIHPQVRTGASFLNFFFRLFSGSFLAKYTR